MQDNKVARLLRGAIALRQQFAQSHGGIFSHVLSEAEIATVVSTHVKNYRQRVYPPLDTLRLFVGQVLSADRACQDVVGRRLSERIAHGQSASTLNTGSYCDARARLPVEIPQKLSEQIGRRLETTAPPDWRWQGRTGPDQGPQPFCLHSL